MDIISSWDINSNNNFLLKKYTYVVTVSPQSLSGKYSTAQGFLFLELERGKWKKRFCYLKHADIFYLEDSKV